MSVAISALPPAQAITGAEVLPIVQNGFTRRATISDLIQSVPADATNVAASVTALDPVPDAPEGTSVVAVVQDGDAYSFTLIEVVEGGLPAQLGNGGRFLQTDGSDLSWAEAGYLDIPQVPKDTSYEFALTDRGKHIYSFGSPVGDLTWSIPGNVFVAFPTGTAITCVNNGDTDVIVEPNGGVTLILAGTGDVASVTISPTGMATLLKVGTNTWFISGVGVA